MSVKCGTVTVAGICADIDRLFAESSSREAIEELKFVADHARKYVCALEDHDDFDDLYDDDDLDEDFDDEDFDDEDFDDEDFDDEDFDDEDFDDDYFGYIDEDDEYEDDEEDDDEEV